MANGLRRSHVTVKSGRGWLGLYVGNLASLLRERVLIFVRIVIVKPWSAPWALNVLGHIGPDPFCPTLSRAGRVLIPVCKRCIGRHVRYVPWHAVTASNNCVIVGMGR